MRPLFSALILALTTLASGAASAAQDAVDLDAGYEHTCFVTSCGDIRCFGRNDYGQATDRMRSRGLVLASAFQPAFAEVTVGRRHTCGLDVQGGVRCWGTNVRNQLNVPAGVKFTTIDAGDYYTCGLDAAGRAHCWGLPLATSPAAADRFEHLTAGPQHACGVLVGGTEIRCWGEDGQGQARLGRGAQVSFPQNLERFTEVSAGAWHTCAISNFGTSYCWGYDGYGAVDFGGRFLDLDGDGVYAYASQFQSQVTAGQWGTCVHYHPNTSSNAWNDRTYCWGYPFENEGFPAPPTGQSEQLSVGSGYACLIDDSARVQCWGSAAFGAATPPTLAPECPAAPPIGPRGWGG